MICLAEDIYFSNRKNTSDRGNPPPHPVSGYTEKIDIEQLSSRPGQLSFNNIKTENGYIKAPDLTKEKHRKAKKKKKKLVKVLSGLFVTALCFLLVFAIGASVLTIGVPAYLLQDYTPREFTENTHIDEASLVSSSSVYNLLLMGTDTLNTEDTSRSDAMILFSVDMKHGKIKLTSFLRDTYVYIPGIGNSKLNAACVYGGPQLVCDTIEYNFGIRIDDYVKVGYDMFIEIIDAVGGVTIPEIDETEAAALLKEGFSVEPGENIHLDGSQALLYCRIRKGQNDFYRTERQREVITQVIKEALGANPVKLLSTAQNIAGTVECSVEKSRFPSLIIQLLRCITGDITQFTVPAEGTWYNDTISYQAVLVPDLDANKEKLTEFLYE